MYVVFMYIVVVVVVVVVKKKKKTTNNIKDWLSILFLFFFLISTDLHLQYMTLIICIYIHTIYKCLLSAELISRYVVWNARTLAPRRYLGFVPIPIPY